MNSAFNSTMDRGRGLLFGADDLRDLAQFAKSYQRRLDQLARAHQEGDQKAVKNCTGRILKSFGAKVCVTVRAVKLQSAQVPPTFTQIKERAERTRNKTKYVIAYQGRQIGLIRKGFLKIARKVGLKGVSPHTLKHTAITWMLQNKVQPWQVSGLTATSVTTLLRVYGHHVQDDLREAANAVMGRNAQRTRNGRATQPVL